MLVDPEMQIGDCYVEGELVVDTELVTLLVALNRTAPTRASLPARCRQSLERITIGTSRRRAARNARHHYSLGNEFYALWLDPSLAYTCAYYPPGVTALADAQRAKLDYVCRKLALAPGERVVEAGSGWGSLAIHMAREYGVHVKAYNLVEEQVEYARGKVRRLGLQDSVEFVHGDYRQIEGRFDAFVSVGMLEHVGRRGYVELGSIIRDCLEHDGRGLVHSIGRHRPMASNRWIRRRVFPGGYTPSLQEMLEIFEPNGLAVLDVENLRTHYVRTLEAWLGNFERASERVAALFDERFVRMWRLYLASSIASFRTGWHELYQVVFSPAGADPRSATREGIYRRD
jgi:cyclopropane-fatty-acyl-phospholipid synthase